MRVRSDRLSLLQVVAILTLSAIAGCSGEVPPQVAMPADERDLDALLNQLHASARDGLSSQFHAAAHELIEDEFSVVELLERLESGSYDVHRLDITAGGLDLAVRLLSERSTALCGELKLRRGELLDRAFEGLLVLPPEYAAAMLDRWGPWGYFESRHGGTLVQLAFNPECREVAIGILGSVGLTDVAGHGSWDAVSAIFEQGNLTDEARASIVGVLMSRGLEEDLAAFGQFLDALPDDGSSWDLLGKSLRHVADPTVAREVIDLVSAWKGARGRRANQGLGSVSPTIVQAASQVYFDDPFSPISQVALTLAHENAPFLQSVLETSPTVELRLIALEILVREHLDIAISTQEVEALLSTQGSTIASSIRQGGRFLEALAALCNRAAIKSTVAERAAIEQALDSAEPVLFEAGHLHTLSKLRELLTLIS